ncbi:hypothetical protein Gotur_001918 [Gossypium turneri]
MGQAINFVKLGIMFNSNTSGAIKDSVKLMLGVNSPLNNRCYLRLPSLVGRNKRQTFVNEFTGQRGIIFASLRSGVTPLARSNLPLENRTVTSGATWALGNFIVLTWCYWKAGCENLVNLVSHFFKDKYFPSCSLFEADEAANQSFIWQSLMDPWLIDDNFYVDSLSLPGMEDLRVSGLLNVDGCFWNKPLVEGVFSPSDCERIWRILHCLHTFLPVKSQLLKRGIFVTQVCREGDGNKDIEHALLRYCKAQVVWTIAMVPTDKVTWLDFLSRLLTMSNSEVLYNVYCFVQEWVVANVVYPEAESQSASEIEDGSAVEMIGGLSEAPRCQPTLSQLFKCNVNASIFVDEPTVRVGLVLRDSRGVLIKGLSTFEKVTFSPRLAEAFAIREALSWLKSNH